MKIYIRMVICKGVLWKPTYKHYYTCSPFFSTPFVKRIMSYHKFFRLISFIDFVDNESLRNTYEKTAKIKPLHNLLVKCFQTIYKPEKDISIDESLLLWKGMFSWKQYIPNKGSRFGMRAFILSEVDSGYIWTASSTMGKN